MKPATSPRSASDVRILVVDGASGAMRVTPYADIATLFAPGDLLVVNDAATLPASFLGRVKSKSASPIELRLVSFVENRTWTVGLLGEGDYRTRTEDRALPPTLRVGDEVLLDNDLKATVTRIHDESARLVDVCFSIDGLLEAATDDAAIYASMYRAGKPVQYAHVPAPLALWDVQNVYAGRPWAVEMPSAGRALRVETILELQRRGIEIARVTHAAGISSIGDPIIDAMLPLPERFEVSEETWEAIDRTKRRGGRVIAIGTSAARALEGGARASSSSSPSSRISTGISTGKSGVTDLRIGPTTRRAIVDAVLTGVHDTDTSHFTLLRAFASEAVLNHALARAESEGLLGHELGDACLVWGQPRDNMRSRRGEDVGAKFFDARHTAGGRTNRDEKQDSSGLWRAAPG